MQISNSIVNGPKSNN